MMLQMPKLTYVSHSPAQLIYVINEDTHIKRKVQCTVLMQHVFLENHIPEILKITELENVIHKSVWAFVTSSKSM